MEDFIGLLISATGVNVDEAASIKDFDFHSDYPLLKIANSGKGYEEFALVSHVGSGSVVINHGLYYIPRVLVYVSIENGAMYNDIDDWYKAPFSTVSASMSIWDSATYAIDEEKLTITVDTSGGTSPVKFGYAYYIFYDQE